MIIENFEDVKSEMLELKEILEKEQKDIEKEKEETRRDCETEKLEDREDSQVIVNGPCPTGLEDKEEDFEGRDEKVDEKVDERLKAIKVEKERNKNRIWTFRRDIKKAIWMLEQNKEFYKLVEKLVGSQFAAENGIMYELDMDLINL